MNDKAKLGLSIAAIILCGGFIINVVSSSRGDPDQKDGGTLFKCTACGEEQVIDDKTHGQFYDDNPSMLGQPMVCPLCNKGQLVSGLKCPVNGCFYVQAEQMADGRPVCPKCKKPLP
ncbi:MAG: hypothetical protein MK293_10585 [Pedosphaera sp.]|jgi:hypothetical protein|nr:hypothetical protein [Pedosphaera sp.]